MPVLHVTNWSSTKLHGAGPILTIMALPRAWEHGAGRVDVLLPSPVDLRAVQAGTLSPDGYRAIFEAKMERALQEGALQPHVGLMYTPEHRLTAVISTASAANVTPFAVEDGSTLCCACSKQKAAEGHCHRTWAAAALARAGWDVILDGVRVDATSRNVRLMSADPPRPENPIFPWPLKDGMSS